MANVKDNFKQDFRVQISMNEDNSKFFIDLHRELLSILNKRDEIQLEQRHSSEFVLGIRSELGVSLCLKIDAFKDDFFNMVICKLDLDSFVQHITMWNYYSSIESYGKMIMESISTLFEQFFHRLLIIKETHDRFIRNEKVRYGRKKMISYHNLYSQSSDKYLNSSLIDLYQIYIDSIDFTRGFFFDEMKFFSGTILQRKEVLFELLKMKVNPVSLKRRKNLCETEISLICFWKKQMKEEFPSCLDLILGLIGEELYKINMSIKDREDEDVFFRSGDDEFRMIDSHEMKKCYKQLVGVYFDCSSDHFCNVILKEDGRIDWKGKVNELLYFAALLNRVGIVKDNYRFLYRFFTIKGEAIIEDNNYKSIVSGIRSGNRELKRKKSIERAFSHITD